jgi:hypothetical protein
VIIFETETDAEFTKALRANLQRLIMYAQSADEVLQREVAERLANEAVKPSRQVQIVQLGGLQLLLPLTRSADTEVSHPNRSTSNNDTSMHESNRLLTLNYYC